MAPTPAAPQPRAAVQHPACWTSADTPYLLVGSQHSYFTGKLRAYLQYRGVPFVEVVSSMDVYAGVIIPATGVRFIPVLVCPGGDVVLQDTTAIMDHLEAVFPVFPGPPALPSATGAPRRRLAVALLELLGDEWLTMPAMHYRWSFPRQRRFIDDEFGRTVSPDAPPADRLAAAHAATARFSAFLPPLGVTAATAPAIEAAFRHVLAVLEPHFAEQAYLFGGRPTVADFALYGPLGPHLFRDPVPGGIMQTTAPSVAQWVERLACHPGVLARDDPCDVVDGRLVFPPGTPRRWHADLPPDDAVPEAVLQLLRVVFDEQLPVVVDAGAAVARFLRDTPDAHRIPRALGTHTFSLPLRSACDCAAAPECDCRASGSRAVMTYPVWMLQRATALYTAASPAGAHAMHDLLAAVSPSAVAQWKHAVDVMATCPITRRNNLVVPLTPAAAAATATTSPLARL